MEYGIKIIMAFSIQQIFAREVTDKVRQLDNEKMKTERVFHDFLPKSIARDLKKKRVSQ